MKLHLALILFISLAVPHGAPASGARPPRSDAKEAPLDLSLSELASNPSRFEGKVIKTGGILIQSASSYFPKPVFMLTNGTDSVRVSPWLPLEAAPSPKGSGKQRIKAMSDFIDKYVIISGKVILEDGKPLIEVKDAETK